MRTPAKRRRLLLILALALVSAMGTALVAGAVARPAEGGERFTGSLVNLALGARFSQPFILSIDHYDTAVDLARFNDLLNTKGPYSLRDELWRHSDGYLSVGGRIGYPVAAVYSQDGPNGRTLFVLINRPLFTREVVNYTRSSRYPFSVLELNVDRNGNGDGRLIAAARVQLDGNNLTVTSLGTMPIRLLAVRAE
jgi:hypothetical protein